MRNNIPGLSVELELNLGFIILALSQKHLHLQRIQEVLLPWCFPPSAPEEQKVSKSHYD